MSFPTELARRQALIHAPQQKPPDARVHEYKVNRLVGALASDPSAQAVIAQRLGLVGATLATTQRSQVAPSILVGSVSVQPSPRSQARPAILLDAERSTPNRQTTPAPSPPPKSGPNRQGSPMPF